MDSRYAVLVTVSEEGDQTLVGRTLLQKKIFFANLITGQDFGFRPHYFGPYSRMVADATDSLVSNRFLEEQVHLFGDSNEFGEIRRHQYSVTADGADVLKSLKGDPEVLAWKDALRLVNSHGDSRDFNILSIAAKVVVITGGAVSQRESEVAERAKAYGWDLSPRDVRRVIGFLSHVKLTK